VRKPWQIWWKIKSKKWQEKIDEVGPMRLKATHVFWSKIGHF
jgi:hypothetical protein